MLGAWFECIEVTAMAALFEIERDVLPELGVPIANGNSRWRGFS
jgi:hypothetical protein